MSDARAPSTSPTCRKVSQNAERQQTLHHKEAAGAFSASFVFRSQLVVKELGQVDLVNKLNDSVLAVPLLILLDRSERIAGDGDGGLAAGNLIRGKLSK